MTRLAVGPRECFVVQQNRTSSSSSSASARLPGPIVMGAMRILPVSLMIRHSSAADELGT